MNILKRLAVIVTAAAVLPAATTSCGFTTETYNINITVPLDDIDFTDGSCHGISFISDINGTVIVTCDDVEEPVIRVKVDFGGGLKNSRKAKKRKEERDRLVATHELNEDGILIIDFVDKGTGKQAHPYCDPLRSEDENRFTFPDAQSTVTMTLPRSFDSFLIRNYGGDIGVKDLSGKIIINAGGTFTAENISFDSYENNMVTSKKDVIISTARAGNKRANALISTSFGDITYVLPEPADLTGRNAPDTIIVFGAQDKKVTIDLNGSECTDTKWKDDEGNIYNYSVNHGAALLDIDNYGNGVSFTNGTYKSDKD